MAPPPSCRVCVTTALLVRVAHAGAAACHQVSSLYPRFLVKFLSRLPVERCSSELETRKAGCGRCCVGPGPSSLSALGHCSPGSGCPTTLLPGGLKSSFSVKLDQGTRSASAALWEQEGPILRPGPRREGCPTATASSLGL